MGRTKIEWTDYTFNAWAGCTKIAEGCRHCYAAAMARINPAVLGEWGPAGKRAFMSDAYWRQPEVWNQAAIRAGVRRRVFCGSLMDVFDEGPRDHQQRVNLTAARVRVFRLIEDTFRGLDWQLLTKRPHNWSTMLPERWRGGLPRNVWMGYSASCQTDIGFTLSHLQAIPAAVRFLSLEPLLEPLDLGDLAGVAWVIAGGESGPHARPCHPDWVRGVRDQCVAAGVPFFFKQWGEWLPISQMGDGFLDQHSTPVKPSRRDPDPSPSCPWRRYDFGLRGDGYPIQSMFRLGKKAAGRLLDGREWSEFPSVSSMASVAKA